MTSLKLSKPDLDLVLQILNGLPQDVSVIAFGSRIDGTAHEYSDLDLCLKRESFIDDVWLGDLKESFQKSNLPFKVDLSRYEDLPESFKLQINQNGQILL